MLCGVTTSTFVGVEVVCDEDATLPLRMLELRCDGTVSAADGVDSTDLGVA